MFPMWNTKADSSGCPVRNVMRHKCLLESHLTRILYAYFLAFSEGPKPCIDISRVTQTVVQGYTYDHNCVTTSSRGPVAERRIP